MRLIDADALKDKAWKTESEACFYALEDVVSVTDIDDAPTIDIVRCKECKYGQDDLFHMFCAYHHHKTYADDFCSYGEREGE